MLDTYLVAPKTLRRLRTGPAGAFIDGFADALERDGYSAASAERYIRAADHLGRFMLMSGRPLAEVGPQMLEIFRRHLPTCSCPDAKGGKANHHVYFGAKRFREYLIGIGVCQAGKPATAEICEPNIVSGFRRWMQRHRGAKPATLRLYCRDATTMLELLGHDVGGWDPKRVRTFLLDSVGKCSVSTTEKRVTSARAFLRYLGVHGLCRAGLDQAVPALAHWRLSTLPQCLAPDDVDRLIAACDGHSLRTLRDRAIILLLVRLGVRAGDLANLRMRDIEWETGTLRVSGKGRYEVRLPLPQDAGEALLRYLESRSRVTGDDRVFVRNIAPFRPFVSGDGISSVVKRALKRAKVSSPAKGAHLLRHTAATEMLRHGLPLDQIGMILRHRGIDTTAYYARIDFALLRRIAQPWPEVMK
ncbi:site-specific integrase [Paraburkholderia hospita]|uniref:site-specific integrase n=1 Tax=Paraburkholderia hospita TaxID=169430 RepID=UPI001EEEFF1B|nr:site-specific integrase [Paraburkholderia hospita]